MRESMYPVIIAGHLEPNELCCTDLLLLLSQAGYKADRHKQKSCFFSAI